MIKIPRILLNLSLPPGIATLLYVVSVAVYGRSVPDLTWVPALMVLFAYPLGAIPTRMLEAITLKSDLVTDMEGRFQWDSAPADAMILVIAKPGFKPADVRIAPDQKDARITLAGERESTPPLRRLAAGTVFRDCADCPAMVVIAPGDFIMGRGTRNRAGTPSGRSTQ